MKLSTVLTTLALVAGPLAGFAQEAALMDCTVPTDTQAPVTLSISLTKETSADYVMMTLTESATASYTLFSQAEPGSVEQSLTAGNLNLMVLGEGFGLENGVIKDAGILSLSKDSSGAIEGMLLIKGNIYQLSCQSK